MKIAIPRRKIIIPEQRKRVGKMRFYKSPFDTRYSYSNLKSEIPYVIIRQEANNDDLANWLSTLSGWCEGLITLAGEELILDDYGIDVIDEANRFNCYNKSRRIGMSFAFSMRGLSSAQLYYDYQSIFVSYNQDDANNKIYYAKMGYENLPSAWQKKLVVDNIQRLEFESFSGKSKTRCMLISHPQREPRGKGTKNTDVFLDEFAHYIWDNKIYVASLPMISLGGSLFIGSTPLGNRGMFFEIATDQLKYNYKLKNIPFYHCPRLVTDVELAIDMLENRNATINEVVATLGTDVLVEIFTNMDFDFFEQEYNCKFLDDASFYFNPELINFCKYPYRQEDFTGINIKKADKYPIELKYGRKKFNFCEDNLGKLLNLINTGRIFGNNLFAGYDVGRKKDAAEFIIVEEDGNLQTVIFFKSLKKTEFDKQFNYIQELMTLLPSLKLGIDETGQGIQLAEQLFKRFGSSRIKRIPFTNKLKNKIFSNLKIRFESQAIAIPDWPELIRQLVSIRRKITEFSNIRFEVEKTELKYHHADKVVALALASFMGTPAQKIVGDHTIMVPELIDVKRKVYIPGHGKVNIISSKQPMFSKIKVLPKVAEIYPITFESILGRRDNDKNNIRNPYKKGIRL